MEFIFVPLFLYESLRFDFVRQSRRQPAALCFNLSQEQKILLLFQNVTLFDHLAIAFTLLFIPFAFTALQ